MLSSIPVPRPRRPLARSLVVVVLAGAVSTAATMSRGLDFAHLAALRTVSAAQISPDGSLIAYTLNVPRRVGTDDDGPAWTELHVVPSAGGATRPYVQGRVNVSDVRFTPDGRFLTYLAKRGDDEHEALWALPVDGGESRKVLEFESGVGSYRVAPDGERVAFLATEPESEERKNAREKGYSQEVFEEDWRPRRLWIATLAPYRAEVADPLAAAPEDDEPRALPLEGSAFGLEWSPDGSKLAVAVAPSPLVDDRYMLRRIHVVEAATGSVLARVDNPGKLGAFRFSPDGEKLAMISAADPNDPREGRLMVAPVTGGQPRDLLPGLEGQVADFAWRDDDTLVLVAEVGVETRLGQVGGGGGKPTWRLASNGPTKRNARVPVIDAISVSADGRRLALVGETAAHPDEVYSLGDDGETARRLTVSNPWLDGVELARQEVVRFEARDGLELEGLLLHPLGDVAKPAPLILMVHGGPEGHDRNGWPTSYSRPGQLAAAHGYAVLYPNYRGSTGRGVAFSKLGQGDAAGKEFDDLVDAVDHLVDRGIADGERVGILGGSYGGYATAWCATRHTERFRAGVMFVGISNKISKGLTTEIPLEDKMVHTRFDPWTRWQFSLERSPLYYAEQSRTALLIAHGTNDTRVHPAQSLQLYRALKLIGKTPVRYVRYPGEGHGNRRAAARDDYTHRLIRWMNHFLVEGKADLPPWDLGLGADADEEDGEAE